MKLGEAGARSAIGSGLLQPKPKPKPRMPDVAWRLRIYILGNLQEISDEALESNQQRCVETLSEVFGHARAFVFATTT